MTAPAGDSIEILLVEDNPGDAEWTCTLLRSALGGAADASPPTPVVVQTLAEACEAVQAERFDLALVDMGLPDSDGAATVAGLHACAADVPLVVLTGSDDDTATRETFAAGAQDYLVKGGFDAPLLRRTMRHALERHRLAAARARAEKALRESEERYRSLSEASFEGVAIHDNGTIVDANTSFASMFGYAVGEVVGRHAFEFTAPESRPLLADMVHRTAGEPFEGLGLRRDGTVFPGELRGKAVQYQGRAARVVSIRDLTARKRVEAELRRSEQRFRTLLETSPAPLVVTRGGTVVYANPAFCALLDSPDAAALVGRPALGFVAADFRTAVARQLQSVQSGERPAPGEQRWTSLAGRSLWVAVSNVPITYEDQPAVLKFAFDVTARRRAEDALHEAKDLFESAFAAAPIGMTLVGLTPDTAGRFLQVNAALCELLGYPADALTGMSVLDVTHPEDAAEDAALFSEHPTQDIEQYSRLKRYLRADGDTIWVHVHATVVHDADGEPMYLVSHALDVTAAKQAQEELTYQALHDPLTGLANRHLLLARLQHSLDELDRTTAAVAVLYLDLDDFKTVNDTLGHDAGDDFLAEVGRRIGKVMRRPDTAARIGGDEFVVVTAGITDDQDVFHIIERIRGALAAPILIGADTFPVSASIGVVFAHSPADDPADILRHADMAMYRAKQHGHGRFAVFDDALRLATGERLDLERDLHRALDDNHLRVHYQPIVDLADTRVVGVEALVRLQHPNRGLLLPAVFLDVAEASGLIVPIGDRVLHEACRQQARWERELPRPLQMAVNLSGRQVLRPALRVEILDAIDTGGIDPHRLTIELTETVFTEASRSFLADLAALKARGVLFALDDFGTGYSSLAYLERFPVDMVKIGQRFVAGLGVNSRDTTIVNAIVNLGHTLDLTVIAEGVETPDQLHHLRNLGCDLAQGFHFARPGPPDDIARLASADAPLAQAAPP